MEQNDNRHTALHAPNILSVCIDAYDAGEASGRIFHCYNEKPQTFANVIQLIEIIEDFFDGISFPQASTKTRTFIQQEPKRKIDWIKVTTTEEIAKKRGQIATFLLYVKFRQNSCWQGEAEWIEGGSTEEFLSVLEWLKIVNNSLEIYTEKK
ncbi:MAG: hypothetical protein PHN80_01600 [Hespellia sp.]|nr:hypothetical protein [Hespellia sp.]